MDYMCNDARAPLSSLPRLNKLYHSLSALASGLSPVQADTLWYNDIMTHYGITFFNITLSIVGLAHCEIK